MRIVVTGTSGGVGGAVASAARALGHEVVEVNRAQFESSAPLLDVTEVEAVVFATGCCPVKPLGLISDASFDETMHVNCGTFLRLMRELVTQKRFAAGGAKVLAVSSVSATEGWAGGAAYCASKGALSALCRALDAELSAKKISVKALEPRYIRTKMFEQGAGRMGVPASAAVDPAEFAAEVLGHLV